MSWAPEVGGRCLPPRSECPDSYSAALDLPVGWKVYVRVVTSNASPDETRSNTPGTASDRAFSVPAISCDHCKSAIESSVAGVAGVEAVEVDVAARSVAVRGGHDEDVVAAIRDAGYEVA